MEVCTCSCMPHMKPVVAVTYLGHLGDRYTGLGAQTVLPKKHFSGFLFSVILNKKYVAVVIIYFTMHLIISKWLRIQKSRQKGKAMRQNGQSERRNCQQNFFHLFHYVIDYASICFFFYVNNLHYFLWFFLYHLQHLLSSNHFTALTILEPATFFI